MTSLCLDVALTLLAYTITHSAAFILGAAWHHWHLDLEESNADGTEART